MAFIAFSAQVARILAHANGKGLSVSTTVMLHMGMFVKRLVGWL